MKMVWVIEAARRLASVPAPFDSFADYPRGAKGIMQQ